MIKCKQCGLDVPQTSKRERLYCDDKCRMAFKRSNSEQIDTPIANKSITNIPKTNNEQENNPIANIPTPNTHKSNPEQTDKNPDNIPGICHGCGIDTHWDICDICSECVGKGLTRKKLNLPEIERIQLSDKTQSKWNWQKHKIAEKKKIAYILYYLKENIAFNTIIRIGSKLFELNKPKQSSVDIPPQFK